MGLFSRLGIRFDSHTLGNLLKNASPVASLAIGGPLGLAATGGLSALGDLGRGKNIGEALKGGVQNAAIGGGLQAGQAALASHGGLSGLFSGGGDAGGPPLPAPASVSVPGVTPPPSATDYLSSLDAGKPAAGAGSLFSTNAAAPISQAPGGFLSTVGKKAGGVLDFAEAHPNATSGVLQGLGGIASSGSENRLRNAQANALEQTGGLTANELAQRKASQAALAPIFSALNQQNFTRPAVRPNPYATVSG